MASFPQYLLVCALFVAVFICQAYGGVPFVIGHRGASSELPENTLPAFAKALGYGVAGIETDLRLTKDGVIVLFHDDTVDRTTNGTGLLSNYTLAQAKRLSAGYPSRFGSAYAGFTIPTLKEGLQLLLNSTNTGVMIMDLKEEGLAQKIALVLQEVSQEFNSTLSGIFDRVVASCWTPTQVADISRYLNITVKQKLGYPPSDFLSNGYFSDLLSTGVHSFSLSYPTLTPSFVLAAHLRLMPVVAWTVDDTTHAGMLADGGVDGLITNVPGQMEAFLAQYQSNGGGGDGYSSGDMVWVGIGSAVGGVLLGAIVVLVGGWVYFHQRQQYQVV